MIVKITTTVKGTRNTFYSGVIALMNDTETPPEVVIKTDTLVIWCIGGQRLGFHHNDF